jgi:hypothetical protein
MQLGAALSMSKLAGEDTRDVSKKKVSAISHCFQREA